MNGLHHLLVGVSLAIGGFSASLSATEVSSILGRDRPNIVFVVLDDLDLWDVGAYGGPDVRTETIDALAGEGMRFAQYYAAGAVCSPTRVSLLTGHWPSRYGVKRAITTDSFRGIPADAVTLPQLLRTAGYRTVHVGKWHVGTRKPEYLPPNKGFDESVRLDWDGAPHYFDFKLNINESMWLENGDRRHLTEVLTDQAIAAVRRAMEHPDQPLFLNLWYFAPHRPLGQLPGDFDNSRTGYCLEANATNADCPSDRGELAALVTNADRQLARLLAVLDEASVAGGRETIVILASDNGGVAHTHSRDLIPARTERGHKGSHFEGGIKVPLIIRWTGVVPAGTVSDAMVTSNDVLPTLAALVGIDVAGLSLDGESFADVLVNHAGGRRERTLFWENKARNRPFDNRSGIFNRYAVRRGAWKLVFEPAPRADVPERLWLFDLASDPGERVNLLGQERWQNVQLDLLGYRLELRAQRKMEDSNGASYDIVANDLQQQYYAWRRQVGNIPYRVKQDGSGSASASEEPTSGSAPTVIEADTRVDFNDGDFSFAATLQVNDNGRKAVVAEKVGSWTLFVEGGHLQLAVHGQPGEGNGVGRSMVIQSVDALTLGVAHRVAFTVFGWKFGPIDARLYVNGRLAGQGADGSAARVSAVSSSPPPEDRIIHLAGDGKGRHRLDGTISLPRLSVLSFHPGEIVWDYAAWRVAAQGASTMGLAVAR